MICWREGWMPDSRPMGRPDPDRIIEEDGSAHADSLAELRHDLGLDQPYGAQAVARSVGTTEPIALSRAEQEPDPTEPPGPTFIDGEPPDGNSQDEQLPGDAAQVQLDDPPF